MFHPPILAVAYALGMLRTVRVLTLLCCIAYPSMAAAQDPTLELAPLLRSGFAAVQQMSEASVSGQSIAAQTQQTRLNHDKKTTVIVIAVIAIAAVIYIEYQLRHSGISIH